MMPDGRTGRLHAADRQAEWDGRLSTWFPLILACCRDGNPGKKVAYLRADTLHKLLRRAIREELHGDEPDPIRELEMLEYAEH